MQINKLHPLFAAELVGADLAREPDQTLVDTVEQAMDEYAVLVVRGQGHIGDEEHIRFSRAFGPLELPAGRGAQAAPKRRFAKELYDASNLDHEGNIIGESSLFRQLSKGNELFHSDSSFHDMPTKWSLLLGHEVPSDDTGATEFADCRAAYEALPEDTKARIEGLEAEHNCWISRYRAGFDDEHPLRHVMKPVRHKLVRTSASGRKCLYLGAHADHIVGMPIEEGRALLSELAEFASQDRFVYSHNWRQGDLVIWDNRCTLHRATPYAYQEHKRDLRRTTINESGPERSILSEEQAETAWQPLVQRHAEGRTKTHA